MNALLVALLLVPAGESSRYGTLWRTGERVCDEVVLASQDPACTFAPANESAPLTLTCGAQPPVALYASSNACFLVMYPETPTAPVLRGEFTELASCMNRFATAGSLTPERVALITATQRVCSCVAPNAQSSRAYAGTVSPDAFHFILDRCARIAAYGAQPGEVAAIQRATGLDLSQPEPRGLVRRAVGATVIGVIALGVLVLVWRRVRKKP